MPLPVPNLDDRRFDDLVAEARARLGTHLPELTQIAPGDPVHAFIDLFAWLTETILYRANLIPERLRRVFLNLLQIPLRPARGARGVVCVDALPTSAQRAPLLVDGAQLKAGRQTLTTVGELQPTPLSLAVLAKQTMTPEELQSLGLTLQDLHEQFGLRKGETATPFRPRRFEVGKEPLVLTGSLDAALYLACLAPRPLQGQLSALRQNVAGTILNLAIAPADDVQGDAISDLAPRPLIWELAFKAQQDEATLPTYLPLEVVSDSSRGARQVGVVRLRLPSDPKLFQSFAPADPMFSGLGAQPPELADEEEAALVTLWLRLRCPEHPKLALGYLGLNGVDVLAQAVKQDQILGRGTGHPDQVVVLPDQEIDPDSLVLEVEENGAWVAWRRVDFLAGQEPDAKVYQFDPQTSYAYFGDSVSAGYRPPHGVRIRAARYLFGGGRDGNLPPGSIKEVVGGSARHKVRHEWPLKGGIDAESIEAAEKRIPQFLTHRNRAVTREDFKLITEANPVNPVARAEVRPGFLPGARIEAARTNVPGVISVFVLPPGQPALGQTPKPTQGLLKDVFGYLLNRLLIGTELYVLSPEFVPVAVGVRLQVQDPQTERQILREVERAILESLWPLAPGGADGAGWPMGRAVRANELLTQAARVPGVLAVDKVSLFAKGPKGWRRLPEDQALSLEQYQLPELMGVQAEVGTGAPGLPDGIGPMEGQPQPPTRGVPVPVIPDVC